MLATASSLRLARVLAKRDLLQCATESGVIALSRDSSIAWWAAGPRDAAVIVLLAAQDGDPAAYWGTVALQLVRAFAEATRAAETAGGPSFGGLRVVAFHRTRRGSGGRTDAAGQPPAAPLSLRMRDVDEVASLVLRQRRDATATTAAPPRFIMVGHGAGSWAALGLASEVASAVTKPGAATIAGVLLVSPMLQKPGPYLAWWGATRAASRVSAADAPRVLDALLPPPPALPGSEAAKKASHERNLWAHSSATRPFLSELEQMLLRRLAPALASPPAAPVGSSTSIAHQRAESPSTRSPPVAIVTLGRPSDCVLHPPELHLALQTWWLMAANDVGAFFLPEGAVVEAARTRVSHLFAMTREIALQRPVAAVSGPESELPMFDRVSEGVQRAVSDAVQRVVENPAESASSTEEETAADYAKAAETRGILQTLPFALGLISPPRFERTEAFHVLEHELAAMPQNVCVTLVDDSDSRQHSTAGLTDIPLELPGLVVSRLLEMALQPPGCGLSEPDQRAGGSEPDKSAAVSGAPSSRRYIRALASEYRPTGAT